MYIETEMYFNNTIYIETEMYFNNSYCFFSSNRQLVSDELAYSNNIQPVSRIPSGE